MSSKILKADQPKQIELVEKYAASRAQEVEQLPAKMQDWFRDSIADLKSRIRPAKGHGYYWEVQSVANHINSQLDRMISGDIVDVVDNGDGCYTFKLR